MSRLCRLPWHKRKSYARDSAGFEPIEEYFKAKNIEESGTGVMQTLL